MKQTMLLKLAPTEEQHRALLETMHAFNAACNYVAEIAYHRQSANKFALQKIVYGELRTTYRLAAQLAIRAISKASEAYKRDKSIQPTFKPEGALVYDERVMSFKGLLSVSLLTISGRVLVPFRIGGYQEPRLDQIKGQADLLLRNGTFFLAVTLDVPEPTPDPADGTLGVDLGIVNLATDSTGETFCGQAVEHNRQRMHSLRQRLQRRGTKSAKRHLKKLSGRQARFQKNTNHVISKRIVAKAKHQNNALALEELRHIRSRTERTVRHSQRGIGRATGRLGNCVSSSPIRLALRGCQCIRSTHATPRAPAMCACIARKPIAGARLFSSARTAVIPTTLIGTPPSLFPGPMSCGLL